MAPNIVTANVEQRSSTRASSDDNISNAMTQEKHSWFRASWSKRWSQNLKIPLLNKHKKKPCKERPKVAISRSPKRWLIPIMIHIIPILAGIVIAAINLKGYFVGAQFVGVTNSQGQSTALFSLQVTAKVLEIVVIASLGFIVLDVVHYFLLFDDAGLPFSLVGARLTFNDISYLASPAFWRGINALRSYSARIFVAFLLVSCGILATFIGPAAALLLIPSDNPNWPAGGLRFLVPLTETEIWPMKLNKSHTGPDYCFNPMEAEVAVPQYNDSACLWYGGTRLAANIMTGWHSLFGSLQTDDFLALRDISWSSYDMVLGPRPEGEISFNSWVWSGTSIANFVSAGMYASWIFDTGGIGEQNELGQPQPLPLSYARYPFRDLSGDQMMLPGMLAPSARVNCLGNQQDFSSMATLPYPAIPANGTYIVDTNATFLIPSSMVENTSIIRTFWTPKPVSIPGMQGVQADEGDVSQLPSAFLLVQIPTESESAGLVITCSVDARWITNATQLMQPESNQQILAKEGPIVTYTQIGAAAFDAQGRPGSMGISPPLDLDISWLEQLTPSFNDTYPGFTSLARSIPITYISPSLLSSLEHVNQIYQIAGDLELLVATLIVDGMARINSQYLMLWPLTELNNRFTNSYSSAEILLPGGGGTDSLSLNASEMAYPQYLWTVSISGYAYTIESTGDILALVVIFVYILFALGHICFIFYKRWYSVDWWSVADMIALSQTSPPSDLLKNTSGGIEAASTNRLLLRLRAPDVPLGDRENIHVLVCEDKSDLGYQGPSGYHKIEKEKAYC